MVNYTLWSSIMSATWNTASVLATRTEGSNGIPPAPESTDSGEGTNDGDLINEGDLANDAEGVWSPDIEQSFQEALAIYPPCGRRKIILSDEGKMYGRNELIARYIKLRTGKTRTRKQVSSHIQVLARRKSKEIQSTLKDHVTKEKVLQSMAAMSSAQIVSASAMHNKAMAVGLVGGMLSPSVPIGPTYPSYGSQDPASRDKALQTMASMSSAQIVSATAMHNKTATQPLPHVEAMRTPPVAAFWTPGGPNQDIKPPYGAPGYSMDKPAPTVPTEVAQPAWQGRSIAGSKLRLVEFSAFLEQQRDPESYHKHLFVHIGATPSYTDPLLEAVDVRQIYDKFPEKKGGLKELYDKGPQGGFFLVKFWADLNTNMQEENGAFYGVTSQYESTENLTIQCSTKVCSFGRQVVEKVETEYAHYENGHFVYRIHRSPMCEYMINFIHKLKHLPEKYMMNSVLENFTILQVVTNRDTQETLLCIAYVFEVSTSEHGAQHHIYRLVKD
ncbi:Transcriptional enhancer factor TEF-1 [Lamellibrachia satsuma]|nr:Transcriptional enhancer factor TEF-1 [Lamellibrachia satsuma]